MSKQLLEYLTNRQKELTYLRAKSANWRDCDYLDGKIALIEEIKFFLKNNETDMKEYINTEKLLEKIECPITRAYISGIIGKVMEEKDNDKF